MAVGKWRLRIADVMRLRKQRAGREQGYGTTETTNHGNTETIIHGEDGHQEAHRDHGRPRDHKEYETNERVAAWTAREMWTLCAT